MSQSLLNVEGYYLKDNIPSTHELLLIFMKKKLIKCENPPHIWFPIFREGGGYHVLLPKYAPLLSSISHPIHPSMLRFIVTFLAHSPFFIFHDPCLSLHICTIVLFS
jgi:hypothetical protein